MASVSIEQKNDGAEEMETSECKLPEHIQCLLSSDTPHDLQVIVGDPAKGTTEKIGVFKWFLIAHSKVLRAMLLESELKEIGTFSVTDLDPQTFKNFIVFLYGHDNISSLSFEEAIKLLYAAEKYDILDLKKKLGEQLESQVNVINVFAVLKDAFVCERVEILWNRVTEIIRSRTDKLFSDDQFLELSIESMLYILQEEYLNIPEIEVWKAALKWGRHKAQSDEGEVNLDALVETLQPLLKHIRFCTLTPEQLCKEVAPTRVFTNDKVVDMCVSIGEQKKNDSLKGVCNEISKRVILSRYQTFKNDHIMNYSSKSSRMSIRTTALGMELCGVVLQAPHGDWGVTCKQQTFNVECTIKIDSTCHPSIVVVFTKTVASNQEFLIPLKTNGRNIVLYPNDNYNINITSSHSLPYFGSNGNGIDSGLYNKTSIAFDKKNWISNKWYCGCHLKYLLFREMANYQ